jgi:hypothetical protein
MSKFRQTASELHEAREDKEKLKKEVSDLKDKLEQLEKRTSSFKQHMPLNSTIYTSYPNSTVSSNQVSTTQMRPPLNSIVRHDQINNSPLPRGA